MTVCGRPVRRTESGAYCFFFFQAEDGIRDLTVTGVQTCALPIFQDGDKFAATIAVRRHTQGPPSVFGIDNVDITLSGKSTPTTASCIGTANQVDRKSVV